MLEKELRLTIRREIYLIYRMAGFQTSQYIDILSVRKIYAKGETNTNIPANSFLGTDGIGGTRWVDISTIKNGITFNTFTTTLSTFTSGPSSSVFSILDGSNVGLIPSASGNSVTMYAKAFGQIQVAGQSSISAYDSVLGNIDSNVQFAGSGVVSISTNKSNQLITFYSPDSATSSMSTLVNNVTNLNSSLSTTIASFNSPFSTFIYSAISSFSTSLGTSLNQEFTTGTLNVSTVNMSGTRQPFIQYGSSQLTNGSTIVTVNPAYSSVAFTVQLTYSIGASMPVIPLSFSTMNRSNFKVVGDSGARFHWTTYGNL